MAVARVTSLEEINRSWSLDDIMQANAVLDFRRDAEAMQAERSHTK